MDKNKKKRDTTKPAKRRVKNNYNKFRKNLSAYLRKNKIKSKDLGDGNALSNYNKLAGSIWRDNKILQLKEIKAGLPAYVEEYRKRKEPPKEPPTKPPKGEKPVIPQVLQTPNYYWNIQYQSDGWRDMPPQDNLYGYSNSIMPPNEFIKITGRDVSDRNYREYFKEWVDFANAYHDSLGITKSDEIEIFYRYSDKVTEDKKNGRWLVEIFSCDSAGNYKDFGFTTGRITPQEPQVTPKPSPKEPIKEGIDKEIELEREKQKTIREKEESEVKRFERIKELKKMFPDASLSEIKSML